MFSIKNTFHHEKIYKQDMAKAQGQGQGQQQSPWLRTGNMATMQSEQEYIGYSNPSSLKFKTNNMEWMRISPTGEVGIGITSPLYKLHIDGGNVRMENDLLIGGKIGLGILPTDKLEVFGGNVKFHSELDVLEKVYVGTRKPPCEDCGIHPPKLEINGGLRVHSLSGNGNVLALSNNEGVLYPLALSGSSSQVLLGNGSFGNPQTLSVLGNITSGGNLTASCVNTGCLSVSGQTTFSTLSISDRIKTARIVPLDGDSIIAFGEGTLTYNDAGHQISTNNNKGFAMGWQNNNDIKDYSNNIAIGYFAWSKANNALAIGNNSIANGNNSIVVGTFSSHANAPYSIAIGRNVHTTVNAANAIIIGSISSGSFTNDISNSLMVGFNSNIPTLFVGSSNGNNTTGNIGIGTATPSEKLQVESGSIYVRGESQGVIVDAGANKRVGLIKYSGRTPGIWRTTGQNFEIGRVDVTSLPGNPTSFLTDLSIDGNGDISISDNNDLRMRNGHHGLGWYGTQTYSGQTKTFASINIDGPVLYGYSGGALGIDNSYYDGNNNFVKVEKIALRWDGSGNVGVGTTTPPAKLSVKSTGSNTHLAQFLYDENPDDNTTATRPRLNIWGAPGKINLRTTFNAVGAALSFGTESKHDALYISASGNVGVNMKANDLPPGFPFQVFMKTETATAGERAMAVGDTFAKSIVFIPNASGSTNVWNKIIQDTDIALIFRNQTNNTGLAGLVIAPENSGSSATPTGIRIAPDGNVGIGVKEPQAKLHVNGGPIRVEGTPQWTSSNWHTTIENPLGYSFRTTQPSSTPGIAGKYLGFGQTHSGWYWILANGLGGSENESRYPMSLTFTSTGKPILTVAEVSWPDYVFDETYQRPTFEETEKDLKKNKHLRGIAPEKEILENGLDITGTMKGLTLNVEEMRLDAITLHKRLLITEQKNDELQKQIEELKKEIEKLKGK